MEIVDARKRSIGERTALERARQVDEIFAARGRKVVYLDLRRERTDAATLRSLLLGPRGNLRAPTLRVGRTLLVGFDPESYRKVLTR